MPTLPRSAADGAVCQTPRQHTRNGPVLTLGPAIDASGRRAVTDTGARIDWILRDRCADLRALLNHAAECSTLRQLVMHGRQRNC